ncbi:hypothetical protein E6C27_scaffold84G00760 [Cucumis melo var. makuwa]|uniref:Uncharacterized protein n=1 Tax=Cucumis melo var. makuwa TaxID=1194695 RepID=A0A5A7TBJ3_CUCMM|nr:hypothetical protein E6C27_scaffold84G00760 [Cucumis melo var. makuwa]
MHACSSCSEVPCNKRSIYFTAMSSKQTVMSELARISLPHGVIRQDRPQWVDRKRGSWVNAKEFVKQICTSLLTEFDWERDAMEYTIIVAETADSPATLPSLLVLKKIL